MMVLDRCAREETEPVNPTVDPAAIRGFVTTLLAAVGCLPRSRHEDACRSRHAVEGCTTPGPRLLPCTLVTSQGWVPWSSMGYGVTGICWAMAHMNPTSSRAIATTTWLACLP